MTESLRLVEQTFQTVCSNHAVLICNNSASCVSQWILLSDSSFFVAKLYKMWTILNTPIKNLEISYPDLLRNILLIKSTSNLENSYLSPADLFCTHKSFLYFVSSLAGTPHKNHLDLASHIHLVKSLVESVWKVEAKLVKRLDDPSVYHIQEDKWGLLLPVCQSVDTRGDISEASTPHS